MNSEEITNEIKKIDERLSEIRTRIAVLEKQKSLEKARPKSEG